MDVCSSPCNSVDCRSASRTTEFGSSVKRSHGRMLLLLLVFIRDILCGILAVWSRVLYSRVRISIKFGIKGSERKVVLPDLLWSVYVQF
jgi:hypothetical protein